jgi:hypothetical protein
MITITRKGSAGVYGGREESGKPKSPVKWGFWGAAGEGFEPSLTDPELLLACSSPYQRVR